MRIKIILIIGFGVLFLLLLIFGVIGVIGKNHIYDQELDYIEYELSTGEKLKIYSIDLLVTHSYLLVGDDGMILVDSGMPFLAPVISEYIDKIGRDDLNLIFITHSHIDHYGSSAELRRLYGSDIGVHKNDASSMEEGNTRLGVIRKWYVFSERMLPILEPLIAVEPTKPDVIFNGGEFLDEYGVPLTQVLHLPGHTEGHSGLIIDENKIGFIGDIVSAHGEEHFQRTYAHNWEDLHDSIELIDSMNINNIYIAHGDEILTTEEFKDLAKELN